MPVLSTHKLSIGYTKKRKNLTVQSALELKLNSGELVCLIGPNGSGKSTLLRTLAGLQKPLGGKVQINNIDLSKLSQHQKALQIAMVLTDRIEIENATVRDVVSFGRHPHSDWWGNLTDQENALIQESIIAVHLENKINCNINELSDGERQRVMIAKALSQDTPVIMLDEPTAHLDLPNRVEIMLLLHKLARNTQKVILLSTHELDMALQAADRIWLITEKNGVECGIPEDLVFNGSFNRAFESKSFYFNSANGNFSMNYPMDRKVRVSGDKTRMYWTFRALARAGYQVTDDADIKIEICENSWSINQATFTSVESLLAGLNNM